MNVGLRMERDYELPRDAGQGEAEYETKMQGLSGMQRNCLQGRTAGDGRIWEREKLYSVQGVSEIC